MAVYKVYYDAYQEARWFTDQIAALNKLPDSNLIPIGSVGDNAEIKRMLRYDKPDIILTKDGKVVLALEKTTEVPTGHNVGQRFARIVCSAEEKIPFVYFFPFEARKHGEYSSVCWVNARLFDAIKNLSKFHRSPILPVDWPVDTNSELIRDGSQDKVVSEVLTELFNNNFSSSTPIIKKLYAEMEKVHSDSLTRHPGYAKLPPTVTIAETKNLVAQLKKQFSQISLPNYFMSREQSLIYVIGMKYVRSDPYTGTQLIYDYAQCRTGSSISSRDMNLVLHMPNIAFSLWSKAAQSTERKDVKLYSIFSDAILFKDRVCTYARK